MSRLQYNRSLPSFWFVIVPAMEHKDERTLIWALWYFAFALVVLLVGWTIGTLLDDDWVILGVVIMGGTIYLRGVIEFLEGIWPNAHR